ncbi:MAG TPA: carboxypeptidase [Rhizobiaceae bacterium]|nr:carboxypeptidase [Rhizobiaceae bacterium]
MSISLGSASARLIVAECVKQDLLRNQCAYVLATAWHETGAFKYMREIWGPTPAQKRYEGRKDLGNTVKGDGKKFLGRGFVQITGRRNYADWSKRLGLDLLKEPQLAEKPEIAVRILVQGMKFGTFTGKNLGDYITLQRSEFVGARRIVNGTDRAEQIASYARQFDVLLKAEGYGEQTSVKPTPAPPPAEPAPQALGLWQRLINIIFGRG